MKRVNAQRKVSLLKKFLQGKERVLDFGCGDLEFAQALHKEVPTLKITGVDVVDFGIRPKGIRFEEYDGVKLPFKDKTFDAVISYHVLHHTDNPAALLFECMRVSKKTLLVVEPVYRFRGEIIGMIIMDWLFNIWKEKKIALTYRFKPKDHWVKLTSDKGWSVEKVADVELLPRWFPTGRSLLFVCRRARMKRNAIIAP